MSCAASLPEHHSENWRLVDRMWTQGPYLSRLLYVVTSWLSNELILNYKKMLYIKDLKSLNGNWAMQSILQELLNIQMLET